MSPAKWLSLFTTFLYLGATAFGGMWGATEKIRQELVERRRWLDHEDISFFMIAATLLPSPKFLGFSGLTGFRLGGLTGSLISSFGVLLPGAVLIILVVSLISPEILSTTFAPVQRAVSLAVIGLLFGQAAKLMKDTKATRPQKTIGLLLGCAVAVLIIGGVPFLAVVLAGFAAGLFLLKEGRADGRTSSIVRNSHRHDV